MFKMLDRLERLIFPDRLYCICCGNYIDHTRTYGICDHCMDHIGWCNEPAEERMGMTFVKCMDYGIYERSIIFAFKYNGRRYIARNVGEILTDRLESLDIMADFIVPVPIHRKKERKRGFNQSILMGKYLSQRTGIEFLPRCLERTRFTEPMRGLGPGERKENIRGSIDFNSSYDRMIKNKKVILLDDFYTTGSTAVECRNALIPQQPSEIIFLAFAAR